MKNNMWIGIASVVLVLAFVIALKWDAVKAFLNKSKTPPTPPLPQVVTDPWGNMIDIVPMPTENPPTPPTPNVPTPNPPTPKAPTPKAPTPTISGIEINKLFVANQKSEESKLGQLIVNECLKKDKKSLLVADGLFGKKSIAAFDACFPYQRVIKPLNLKTTMQLGKDHYNIVTDKEGRIIDPSNTEMWQKWKGMFNNF